MIIRDLSTGGLITTLQVHRTSAAIAFSPDRSKLATSRGDMHVFDIASGLALARIDPGPPAQWALAFTPDGERLIVSHVDSTALVWDWRKFLIRDEAQS